jgi:hypothetical protein
VVIWADALIPVTVVTASARAAETLKSRGYVVGDEIKVLWFFLSRKNILALPCLALPCLALPCLALPCLADADRRDGSVDCFAVARNDGRQGSQ